MAEATKHLSINGGTLIADLKSHFTVFRTRRSMAFAYGFMFAFVAFTAFLAFNPSSNSSSLWFTSIFTTSTATSSTTTTTTSSSTPSSTSNGSHFSSVFSYFFPNNSSSTPPPSPPKQHNLSSSLPPQINTTRSNNTSPQSLHIKPQPPTTTNHTLNIDNSDKAKVLHANNSTIFKEDSSSVNKTTQTTQTLDKAQTLKPNQTSTTSKPSNTPVAANQTTNSSSLVKKNDGKGLKDVADKGLKSNYTASLSKKQSDGAKRSNETNSGILAKQGMEDLMETLMNCDLFHGEWVHDDSYPLYKPGSCSFIDEQFNCVRNGRPDRDYQKMKWKPNGCTLPRYELQLLSSCSLQF